MKYLVSTIDNRPHRAVINGVEGEGCCEHQNFQEERFLKRTTDMITPTQRPL